jgi:hypothetical protein
MLKILIFILFILITLILISNINLKSIISGGLEQKLIPTYLFYISNDEKKLDELPRNAKLYKTRTEAITNLFNSKHQSGWIYLVLNNKIKSIEKIKDISLEFRG